MSGIGRGSEREIKGGEKMLEEKRLERKAESERKRESECEKGTNRWDVYKLW